MSWYIGVQEKSEVQGRRDVGIWYVTLQGILMYRLLVCLDVSWCIEELDSLVYIYIYMYVYNVYIHAYMHIYIYIYIYIYMVYRVEQVQCDWSALMCRVGWCTQDLST